MGARSIAIPAPFFPFISYQIWEIPIVVVFLMIGPKYGTFAALISGAILFAFFPGVVSLGDELACLSVLSGIYVAAKLIARKKPQQETDHGKRAIVSYVALGTIFRVLIMAVLDYVFLLRPIAGIYLEESLVVTSILIAVFNATQPLYTIPLGYAIARTISKNVKVGNNF
jgi:riboflavin transporter FmnP